MATGSIKKPVRAVCNASGQTKLYGETSSTDGIQTISITPQADGMILVIVRPIANAANEAVVQLLQNGTLFSVVSGSKNSLIDFSLTYPVAKGETYQVQTYRCNIKNGIFLNSYI